MTDHSEAQTKEEELTSLGPEDGVQGIQITRVATLISALYPHLDDDDIEVYFDSDYIRVFYIGTDESRLLALLSYRKESS